MRMQILSKNCFCALNSFESFSSGVILFSLTVYIEMSFGFTPKIGFVSSSFLAAAFHEVHSPCVKIEGTSSAFIFLKSQLLSKLLMIIFNVSTLSFFTRLFKSSRLFVAFKTQMWSFARGVRAETAIFKVIVWIPAFLPKLIVSSLF